MDILKKNSEDISDIHIPVELLKFLDCGAECNPDIFLLKLYSNLSEQCTDAGERVKRLKVSEIVELITVILLRR